MISEGGLLAFVALCVVELLLLLRLRRRVRETTLEAAWCWAIAATVGLAAAEAAIFLWIDQLGRGGAGSLRLIAGPLVFCPAMAVLGAKKPQHRAWQFIVLSMWGVLALPGAEHLVLQRGGTIEMHGVRTAFIAALIGLGVLNWLPTRRWGTAICIAAGQTLLYVEHLPSMTDWESPGAPLAAAFFVIGTGIVVVQDFVAGRQAASGWDRVWRDFRDDFGAFGACGWPSG
jgi:hypothetical protein